jgi:Ca2+/H+ antiporter, TMEM165/GDT1 family
MLRTILSTFVLVFMAEIGDKTQLAAFGLAAEANAPWAVFIGAGAALLLSTALAVVLGAVMSRLIPEGAIRAVHYTAGCLFIIVGVWTIWKA